MSEKYKFIDPEGIYYVSPTIVYWIDLFTRKEFKYLVINSLKYCQKQKGLVVHAYCIMPSHLHLIISTKGEPLESIMRDLKKYLAKAIIKELDLINESRKKWLLRAFKKAGADLKRISNYKVWQDGNQPKQLMTTKFMIQKLDYLHNNPVEAEIVDEPENYVYISARDYAGRRGHIEVELLV